TNDACGGAIYNRGTLYLNYSVVTGNSGTSSTQAWGGGVFNWGGHVEISYSKISSNTAKFSYSDSNHRGKAEGGGVFSAGSHGSPHIASYLKLDHSTISFNQTVNSGPSGSPDRSADGAAMLIAGDGTTPEDCVQGSADIINSTISRNTVDA